MAQVWFGDTKALQRYELTSGLTSGFGRPQDDVTSLFTKCGYDRSKGQRAAEKLAYFLFGRFVVEFDWLSRPNGFEYEKSVR